VLRDLLSTFRNLSGAKLFHSPKIDYADLWRRRYLTQSELVQGALTDAGDEGTSLQRALAAWQKLDGPWREVANAFFEAVRDRLSDPTNLVAPNAWGSTRQNLFNKISLSILIADFFQYLNDSRQTIHSGAHVRELVEAWLEGVDKAYFNRDWSLSGVKKDTPGIRSQWSELWVDYRKDPSRLTDVRNFRRAKAI
jgi:hypothetical protein